MRGHGGRRPFGTTERTPTGINVAVGAVTIWAAGVIAAQLPRPDTGWRDVVPVFAVAGFAALTVDPLATAATAGLGLVVTIGFLENRYGELSWHGATDARDLGALTAAALVGLTLGWACRCLQAVRHPRHLPDVPRIIPGRPPNPQPPVQNTTKGKFDA